MVINSRPTRQYLSPSFGLAFSATDPFGIDFIREIKKPFLGLLMADDDSSGGSGSDDPPVIENPSALLKAHEEIKKENKHLKDRLSGLEKKLNANQEILSTMDPEKYKEYEAKAKEAEQLEEVLAKKTAEVETKYKEQIETLKKQYVSTIDQEKALNLATLKSFMLTQEFVKHGKPELAELFISGYSDKFELQYEGERPGLNNAKLVALDKEGKPRYEKAKDSNEMVEMGLAGWFEASKEDSAVSIFIPAPQSRGTGTHSVSSNGGYRAPSGPPKNANEAFENLPTFAGN